VSDIDQPEPVPVNPPAVPAWLVTSAAWGWRLGLLTILALAALWLAAHLLIVTLPVIVAVLVATLCHPPAQWLKDRGWRPAAAASAVVIGGLVAITGFFAIITPSFIDQVAALGPTLAEAWAAMLEWAEAGPLGWDAARIEELITSGIELLQESSGELLAGVLAGAGLVAQILAAMVLMVVLLFFFIKDGDQLVQWGLDRTPAHHRETVRAVGRRSWTALGGYVRGTAFVALIDAVGIAIGLIILGVPLVVPLALLVFIGGFLPVIGAMLSGLIAVLVALTVDFPTALLTLGVVLLVQQIEANFLQPTIMRKAVALHPVVILLALGAGAALAGIVGAFLAVPVAAVVAAAGNELRLRNEIPVGDGADPPPAAASA
jgi:putative heme transporter